MKNKIKHFLNLNEISTEEIKKIIKSSHVLKKTYGEKKLNKKKILAMIFEKPSTRTRVSFEVGMKQLNGDVVTLDPGDTQLGRGESLQDTIKVLGRYVDLIMYRGSQEKKLYEMTNFSDVPIINGLTDSSHPCQILADIMTLEEKFNSLDNLNLCWIGDGNNVCNSWIHSCSHFNYNLKICCPEEYLQNKKLIAENNHKKNISVVLDPKLAIKDSNVVITDTWVSKGMNENPERV